MSQNFNTNSSEFEAWILVNTSVQAASEIYLNTQYWYPDGFDIFISKGGKTLDVTITDQGSGVHSFMFTDSTYDGQLLKVLVLVKSNAWKQMLGTATFLLVLFGYVVFQRSKTAKKESAPTERVALIE